MASVRANSSSENPCLRLLLSNENSLPRSSFCYVGIALLNVLVVYCPLPDQRETCTVCSPFVLATILIFPHSTNIRLFPAVNEEGRISFPWKTYYSAACS
jgi:hypothetical protein